MKVRRLHLKRYQQALGGITAALLIFLLLVRFIYLPVVARIGDRRTRLKDLQSKIADARGLTEQLPSQEAALQQVKTRYETLVNRIGKGQAVVARALETLSVRAKDHRLELVAVQPRESDGGQRTITLGQELTLREVSLTLQLTGRYRQVGEFLGGLADDPLLASVRTLGMAKAHTVGTTLRADVGLAVYLTEHPSPP